MSFNSDQPRDNQGRWASGNSGQRLTGAAAERAALYKRQDESLYHNTGSARPSNPPDTPVNRIMTDLRKRFGDKAPSEDRVREIMQNFGVHSLGVHTSIPRGMK